MKKYNIKSVMVTLITMWRQMLITKESMEKCCKGEMGEKDSVNDDIESLFEYLRLGKERAGWIYTYFLPKLTDEEKRLVDRKDTSYLETFYFSDSCVYEAMELSESDSKFVRGIGCRKTFTIKNTSYKSRNRIKKPRNCSFQ